MKKFFSFLLLFLTIATHAANNSSQGNAAPQNCPFHVIQRSNRRVNAKLVRVNASNERACKKLECQFVSGDEELYADKRASYAKALPHGDNGLPDVNAFCKLVFATQTLNPCDFNNIPMGTSPVERRLVSPQAALDWNLIGDDSWINTMPAPAKLVSAERAGEMVEVYWQALTRDVFFTDFDTDATVAAAITDLNNLSCIPGPTENGVITNQTVFRGELPGATTGPYISQFLLLDVPYSETDFAQTYSFPSPGNVNNFMTTFDEWLFIQRGHNPTRTKTFELPLRYITTPRDLGNYVHHDPPQGPYLRTLLILLSYGNGALDQNNPYFGNPTQEAFVNFQKPQFAELVAIAAEQALQAAWYQKWFVHRYIRPEYYAFLVNQQIEGVLDSGLHPDVINSDAVTNIFALNAANPVNAGMGTYLLPQAFPEGSPTHPSYPAGHATVAGASVTILKAFFNEDFVLPEAFVPDSIDGTTLVAIPDQLTLGNELNKLAANISIGRDFAGVHYRSDATYGLLLGEKIAISILEDWAYTNQFPFSGFSLTKFDGTTITIGANKGTPSLN